MAIVFAVQFVALIGQVMAPSSRHLTSPHLIITSPHLIESHHLISSRLIVAPAGQMNAYFLCLITPLCSYLYGGLYGGLYERAHIIRYFPRAELRGPLRARGARAGGLGGLRLG